MILVSIVLLTLIFAIARQLSESKTVFFFVDSSGNTVEEDFYTR